MNKVGKKKQIVFIGGGTTFAKKEDFYEYLKEKDFNPYKQKKRWFGWVADHLENEYESFILEMPCRQNADYEAWKIWFERIFPFLNREKLILVGGSMGAIFLLKYLSENTLPYPAEQVWLVAPALHDHPITGEILGSFTAEFEKLPRMVSQAKEIFLCHSKDDSVCQFSDSEELISLVPEITFLPFEDKEHFNQETFPELLEKILE